MDQSNGLKNSGFRTISDEELMVLRKMFNECDIDGSGAIDADELGTLVKKLGNYYFYFFISLFFL